LKVTKKSHWTAVLQVSTNNEYVVYFTLSSENSSAVNLNL
jgi:hypothetical protein